MPICLHAVCLLSHHSKSWLGTRETIWPTKLKIFAIWPFIEKACQLQILKKVLRVFIIGKTQTIFCLLYIFMITHIGTWSLTCIVYIFNKSIHRCMGVINNELRILMIKEMDWGRVHWELQVSLYCFISWAE